MTLNTLLFLGGIGVQELALLFIIFGIWIWALIDLLTSNFESGITKIIWLLVILFIPVLGPLAYLIIGRSQKKKLGKRSHVIYLNCSSKRQNRFPLFLLS